MSAPLILIYVHHYTHNNGITPKIGANVLLCEHYITPILNILWKNWTVHGISWHFLDNSNKKG